MTWAALGCAAVQVVASGAVSSGTDVKRFIACTLIHSQHGFGAVAKATIAALHWLKDNGFIRSEQRQRQHKHKRLSNGCCRLARLVSHA
jgi:hypothetical protein